MLNGSKVKDMSSVCYHAWLTQTAKKTATCTPKLKSLPPTNEAFQEHVKRAHHHHKVAVWKSAINQEPPNLNPTEYGWIKHEMQKL